VLQMVSKYYGYNILCTIIFLKTYSEDMLRCSYKDLLVSKGGKLTGFYFLHLLYLIYYLTHLLKGKKVSFLPLGDVNPGPGPSR
jgi:hypothetical protein